MQNSIAVGDTVYIKPGAVYGGSYPSRGAAVPAYMGGYRRYTVGRITHRQGADEVFCRRSIAGLHCSTFV